MATNNLKTRQIQTNARKNKTPKVYNIIKTEEDFSSPPKGQKYSKCQTCGKKFEQIFYSAQNRYSDFKTCPACRTRLAHERNGTLKQSEQTVATLPYTPFPWQKKAGEDFEKVRFQVLACANRLGKGAKRF